MTVALVSGANRGIGFEVARQLGALGWTVLLGSRDEGRGREAAAVLAGEGLDVRAVQLDVADEKSVRRCLSGVERDPGSLDVLVNNAAIHYDSGQRAVSADLRIVQEAWQTNTLGAWRLAQAAVALLRHSAHPRIVNVSSEGGSLASMGGGTPAYRVTKAALNALTRLLAAELRSDGVLVNSICPGWTATDMGGGEGRPLADGAASVVWAAALPDDGPTGGFFRDGRPLSW